VLAMLQTPSVFEGKPTFTTKVLTWRNQWLLASLEGVHYVSRLGSALKGMMVMTAVVKCGPSWRRAPLAHNQQHVCDLGKISTPPFPASADRRVPTADTLGLRTRVE